MEFAKVSPALLNSIDFTLPPDPAGNADVLKTGKGNTQFHLGCARWSNKEWVGKYYPKGTKEKDFLTEYAKQFNCIELNATYYGTPSLAQITAWKQKAGSDDFLFLPKLPQAITHTAKLRHTEALVDEFVYSMAGLGAHAGPVFLMPDPNMDTTERPVIRQFIERFPEGAPIFLELRHPSFFVDGYDEALSAFLKEKARGTVITDVAGRRDCAHMHLTIPQVFIRFVGNALHPTDYSRIDAWVARIKRWMEVGLEQVYFIIHQPDELCTPVLVKYLAENLNRHCGTAIKMPEAITDIAPPTLF